MPCPRSFAELIDQTWPDAREAHDVETYLDQMWERWGHQFPPDRIGGHWVGAQADIQRLAKQNEAAARRPRRPRKSAPAATPHKRGERPSAPTNRIQLELHLK